MKEIALRFLLGGSFVAAFSLVGEAFRPKTFSGLFGAAPSVALASLALTIGYKGAEYASLEARAMLAGAAAFFLYSCTVHHAMGDLRLRAKPTVFSALLLWALASFAFSRIL